MSWSDRCSSCGENRADCKCGNWNGYNNEAMTAKEAREKTEKKEMKIRNEQYDRIISEITAVVNDGNNCNREVWIHGFTPLPIVKIALEKDGYTVHPTINDFKDGIMTRIEW